MNEQLFNLKSYQFDLPQELIAQIPCTPRDSSRLLVVHRASGTLEEKVFHEIPAYFQGGDQLVFNDTKVIPARLMGKRAGGGVAEVFLTRRHADGTWDALVRPGRKIPLGAHIVFGPDFACEIIAHHTDGSRRVQFTCLDTFENHLAAYGEIPLPQYIQRSVDPIMDPERYQTIYAAHAGAVAAPTAGLHFTQAVLEKISERNAERVHLTLHVGLGTFRPVQVEDIRHHHMHAERYYVTPEAALAAASPKTRRIAIGTTSCRALESLSEIVPGSFDTHIFIYPGYKFKRVDALLTNFHLPGSSLLMLVSAFAGHTLIQKAYAYAIQRKFRFFSYGDAMLIL